VPGSKIEIKTSLIKGAGLGVYVTDNFVTEVMKALPPMNK
jgi:hypothetical protein